MWSVLSVLLLLNGHDFSQEASITGVLSTSVIPFGLNLLLRGWCAPAAFAFPSTPAASAFPSTPAVFAFVKMV